MFGQFCGSCFLVCFVNRFVNHTGSNYCVNFAVNFFGIVRGKAGNEATRASGRQSSRFSLFFLPPNQDSRILNRRIWKAPRAYVYPDFWCSVSGVVGDGRRSARRPWQANA